MLATNIPTMGCNFDRWIRLLRQEQLFEKSWIDQLYKAHEDILIAVEETVNNHKKTSGIDREDELDKLYILSKNLHSILAQYY